MGYSIGTLLIFYTLGRLKTRFYVLIAVCLLVLGAADEMTQPFVGRSCTLGDWIADSAGIIAGVVIFLLLPHIKTRNL